MQKFPSNIVKRTRIDGAKSAQTVIDFDNIKELKVGDRMTASGIHKAYPTKLTVKTSNTRATFDRSMTVADEADVFFKRTRFYSIDLIPDLCSPFSSSIPTTDPTYRLYQYDHVILTMKHSIAGTNYTITHNNSATTSLSAGDELEIEYSGKPLSSNMSSKKTNLGMSSFLNKKIQKVSILLDLVDAGHNFTAIKTPTFNTKTQKRSDWTNSVPDENGGTRLRLSRFSHNLTTASNTVTLTYYFEILKLGTKDVTMELDLDSILTITT